MKNDYINKKQFENDLLNYTALLKEFNKKKLHIILISLSFFISFLLYSALLPNIYSSKSILVPVESESKNSSVLQGYSGLASLAGINISDNISSKSAEATEKLKSFDFFSKNILNEIFLPNLVAVSKWDSVTNKIIYKQDVYDYENGLWTRKVEYPFNSKPSEQEAFEYFKEIFSLTVDSDTSLLTLEIKHPSPNIAKKWNDLIIAEINREYREVDKIKASSSIEYLLGQISSTNYAEIKQVLSQLIQNETQKLMLVEINEEYVFKILDSPVAPEEKSSPSRVLISIFGLFMGLFISFAYIIFRFAINNR
jgi:LPS O-antigen subunit length determinant protein (WzzB/FepE family)